MYTAVDIEAKTAQCATGAKRRRSSYALLPGSYESHGGAPPPPRRLTRANASHRLYTRCIQTGDLMGAGMAVVSEVEAERTQSQTVKALLAIRELILEGVLAPGKRISELYVAER